MNFAGDMALMVTDRAVQILGGYGYVRDHPVELWLRNARGFGVMEGIAIV
jgi:acyl-CoA dehydrogenase